MSDRDRHAADVASAAAAQLFNLWEQYSTLPATERFEQLKDVFRTVLNAYRHGLEGRAVPEPSVN